MKLQNLHHKIFTVILIIIVSSSSVLADQDKNNNLSDVAKGAKAWANNCNRCHNVRSPNEFSDDQWRVVTTHMRIRAGLTGEDTRNILKFLQQSN